MNAAAELGSTWTRTKRLVVVLAAALLVPAGAGAEVTRLHYEWATTW